MTGYNFIKKTGHIQIKGRRFIRVYLIILVLMSSKQISNYDKNLIYKGTRYYSL